MKKKKFEKTKILKKKNFWKKKSRAQAGIEPTASPTQTENHATRPLGHLCYTSSENRTRDLLRVKQSS